jgi:hypothetical protein
VRKAAIRQEEIEGVGGSNSKLKIVTNQETGKLHTNYYR